MGSQIVKDHVSADQWKAAQSWECGHWVGAQRARARYGKNYVWRMLSVLGMLPKYRGDDWNYWWKNAFDHYRFLPSEVDNALEVGCGPYTNMRLIQEVCCPKHLVLSDPLIRAYVKFKLTFVADLYRRAACVLDDHALEELPFADNYFDLVVMINVLDHVRDARRCMQRLIQVARPGGWVVIGQDLTNDEDIEALSKDPGAVGHPIKLDSEWFSPWLLPYFEPVMHKQLSRKEGRCPEAHYATLLFAGRKRKDAVVRGD